MPTTPHPAYPWQPKANQWPSAAETQPKESWWLKAQTREELDAFAQREFNRMRWSPHGMTSGSLSYAPDVFSSRRKSAQE